jgi:hypothetical protein
VKLFSGIFFLTGSLLTLLLAGLLALGSWYFHIDAQSWMHLTRWHLLLIPALLGIGMISLVVAAGLSGVGSALRLLLRPGQPRQRSSKPRAQSKRRTTV